MQQRLGKLALQRTTTQGRVCEGLEEATGAAELALLRKQMSAMVPAGLLEAAGARDELQREKFRLSLAGVFEELDVALVVLDRFFERVLPKLDLLEEHLTTMTLTALPPQVSAVRLAALEAEVARVHREMGEIVAARMADALSQAEVASSLGEAQVGLDGAVRVLEAQAAALSISACSLVPKDWLAAAEWELVLRARKGEALRSAWDQLVATHFPVVRILFDPQAAPRADSADSEAHDDTPLGLYDDSDADGEEDGGPVGSHRKFARSGAEEVGHRQCGWAARGGSVPDRPRGAEEDWEWTGFSHTDEHDTPTRRHGGGHDEWPYDYDDMVDSTGSESLGWRPGTGPGLSTAGATGQSGVVRHDLCARLGLPEAAVHVFLRGTDRPGELVAEVVLSTDHALLATRLADNGGAGLEGGGSLGIADSEGAGKDMAGRGGGGGSCAHDSESHMSHSGEDSRWGGRGAHQPGSCSPRPPAARATCAAAAGRIGARASAPPLLNP